MYKKLQGIANNILVCFLCVPHIFLSFFENLKNWEKKTVKQKVKNGYINIKMHSPGISLTKIGAK
jgi:hypothetical protein